MPPSDKELRHLRLVEDEPVELDAHQNAGPSVARGPRLIDATYLTPTLVGHARGRRRALLAPLLAAAGVVALVGASLLVLLQRIDASAVPLQSTQLGQSLSAEPLPLVGPSVRLVAHVRSPTATEYSLRLHNLPGLEREAAAELAVAVIGPRGEVAWLAPAAQGEGVPWPIPHVATLELPDGPRLSQAPQGTRVVALFLRAGAKPQDIVTWARQGGCDALEALGAALRPHVVHVQTLTF